MNTLVLKYSAPDGGGEPGAVGASARRVQLTWELQPNSGRVAVLGTKPAVCAYGDLQRLSQSTVTALRRAYEAMGECARREDFEAGSSHLEKRLRPLGRELGGMLLPQEVIDQLQSDRSISHLIFQYDPLLHWVPFDCIYLADDFLCFRYATGRQLLARVLTARPPRPRNPGQPYRAFSLVDTLGDLRSEVGGQFNEFRAAWGSAGQDRKIDFAGGRVGPLSPVQFAEALRSYDLVNLILHHESEAEPERTGFVLGPGRGGERLEIFTARDLQTAFPPGTQPPRVLLALCCRSGATADWEKTWGTKGEPMHWMVDAAQCAGVRNYLGTITEIPPLPTPRLLPPFYEALREGYSVGESLRRARLALRRSPDNPLDGGTLLALGYLLFGNPTVACFCAGGNHRLDDGLSVLCEAPTEEGFCGKAVCPADEGFHDRRCREHWVPPVLVCSAGHHVSRADALRPCVFDGCHNMVCAMCSGSSQGLCWEHCCFEGHVIVAGARKACRDPHKIHPDEKRSVCPLDIGWLRGLCRECLERGQ